MTLKVDSDIKKEKYIRNEAITEIIVSDGFSLGDRAFAGCVNLKKIQFLGSVKLSTATFTGCYNLEEVEGLAGIEHIPPYLFYASHNLKSIDLGSNLKSIGEGAFGGSGLESIDISTVETLSNDIFRDCRNLRLVKLSSMVEEIPNGVFQATSNLKTIELKDGVKVIAAAAFYQAGLEYIKIPKSVERINTLAFATSDLREIDLSEAFSLNYISADAFEQTKLRVLDLSSTAMTMRYKKDFMGDAPFKVIDSYYALSAENNLTG